jgi:ferredoxin-NADP reductase
MTGEPSSTPRWSSAVIDRVVQQTPRVTSIFLRSPLARSRAGQHVDVRLTAPDGYAAERSYSIASAPDDTRVELAIECLRDGEVSSFFHDVAQVGDTIDVRGPIGGHFVWDADVGGPLLLIGGGSGVAPLMAMVRHRALVKSRVPTLLVYSSRTWDDLIFRDELLALAATDPQFQLRLTTTRGPRQRPVDFERRLDRALLAEIIGSWGQKPGPVYVCGSNAFVEAATGALVDEGLTPAQIRTERFGGMP